MAKKRRSAAQRRATARLVAFNKSRSSKRKSNPIAANPVRRRRRPAAALVRRYTRRRRNPIRIPGMGGIGGLFGPALTGAAGAVAVDAALTYIPLPAALTTGNMANVTRAGAAVLLGTLGRKVFGRAATQMAVGALTVVGYQLARNMLTQAGMPLGYVGAGVVSVAPATGANAAPLSGMGAYLPRSSASGGFAFSPANQFGEYVR